MKLVPTASQTVGPFFSLGLEPLCQDVESARAASLDSMVLQGVVRDGNKEPIPDCVLEFFATNFLARVATSVEGKYLVALPPASSLCEVLVFMRGLLKPALTRVYFDESACKNDSALQNVPGNRVATLVARRLDDEKRLTWNVMMQGEDETVFFDF